MDIAYYLSDLLGELGEVNVPDLGTFTQQKIDGYYNTAEGKFYPPTAEVNYSQQFVDDGLLAEYIADQKKISIASSKYFIEKYSSKIKVDVMMEDVQLANLGWIYPKGDGLAFKKSPNPIADPAFYGYPQIELQQIEAPAVAEKVETPAEVAHEDPIVQPVAEEALVAKEVPVAEEAPVAPTESLVAPEEPAPTLVAHEEPVKESEAVPISHEETPAPEVTEVEPAGDPVDLIVPEEDPAPEPNPYEIKEESVKEPLDFGASMEDYLRELEGGAYVAGPEVTEPPAYVEHEVNEPVIETPEHIREPVAELPIVEPIPEPIVEIPKVEPVPEIVTDIPFPEHTPSAYTPDPEMQRYILDKTPVTPTPEAYTPPIKPVIKPSQEEEEFVFDGKGYDDVDTRRRHKKSYLWLWILLIIVVAIAGVGGYLYFKHQQKLKQKMVEATKPITRADTLKKAAPADSLKDTTKVITDTTENPLNTGPATTTAVTPAIDSTKVRYEIIGTSAKTEKQATEIIKNYKSLGFDSHVVTDAPGRRLKISLGTFSTHPLAVQKQQELLKTRKVQKDIYILPINPKK